MAEECLMFDDFEIKEITREKEKIKEFLQRFQLSYEDNIEYSAGVFDNDILIATGSFADNILKCFAIDPDYQEGGITSKVITHLIQKEHELDRDHLFLFTKPENSSVFSYLGFKEIERVSSWFSLLEIGPHGIDEYLKQLKQFEKKGKNGSIVVNCNPFTLGHRYLIETASKKVDNLYVFLVQEDLSLFPYKIRYELVKEGIKDLNNVKLLNGGEYIISQSTFPNYFIRNKSNVDIIKAQTTLDLKIFGHYIAKALNIKYRFVGTEPYCETTNEYNSTMKEILPEFDVELIEIERVKMNNKYISASTVRELIKKNDFTTIKKLVPISTYDFLVSEEGKPIVEKIKNSDSRH